MYAAVIRPWSTLKLRAAVNKNEIVKIHFGSGAHRLNGWINVDLNFRCHPDVILDVGKCIPVPDASVDHIFSEDLIEHLEYKDDKFFIQECYRILKPGGIMRILTPNLEAIVRQYVDRDVGTLNWYDKEYGCRTFGEMLNAAMRGMGHRFIYDEETLRLALEEAGFKVQQQSYNKSYSPHLCGLDIRGSGSSLFLDCIKH